MKRREFIKTTAVATAALSLPAWNANAKTRMKLGLQLYTLRDTIEKDPKGVLQKVAGFGYQELETYGYADGRIYGMDFASFGKYVKDLGMEVVSGHYSYELATGDKWEKAVSDAKAIGQQYMVVPSLGEDVRKTLDDYKRVCEKFNKAGEICKKYGIRFGYHNHDFEFRPIDGKIPFDVMLAELDDKYVGMEMDIYWVVFAGHDPLKYFEQYPRRFEQWHVKDMDKADRSRNANIGSGSIDFNPIFAQAKQSGMKHFYVEQESYPGEPIDSVGASAQYLKTIL